MRLVVLISGRGSNLQAILDACQRDQISGSVVAVISNRRKAYGLERARKAGVPTEYFPLKPYRDDGRSRDDYDTDLADLVSSYKPDLVVLAGWMHILSPAFLNRFRNRVINLHPALPGEFPGTQAIERAFQAAQQGDLNRTGVMVHVVVPEVDAGPVLASEAVPIDPTDDLQALKERIHTCEHRLLVSAIAELAASWPDTSSLDKPQPHETARDAGSSWPPKS